MVLAVLFVSLHSASVFGMPTRPAASQSTPVGLTWVALSDLIVRDLLVMGQGHGLWRSVSVMSLEVGTVNTQFTFN